VWDQIKAKLDDDEFLAREYRRAKRIMRKEQRAKALQTEQEAIKSNAPNPHAKTDAVSVPMGPLEC
jgi:hypothetical protein